MPHSYTMTGDTIDTKLVNHAARSSPRYWNKSTRKREDLKGMAAVMRAVDAQVATGRRLALVDTSQGAWLDEIGKDRVIPRRGAEADSPYKVRLKSVEDKVTPSALLAAATGVIAEAGLTDPAYLVELYRDGVACDVGFLDSERPIGPGPAVMAILPPAASETTARSVYEVLRKTKAAGVYVLVFPSVTGGRL